MFGHQHQTFNTLSEDFKDFSVVLSSATKSFNIAGVKCAYAIIENQDLREKYLQRNKLKLRIYPNAANAIMAYESGLVDLHGVCAVRLDIDGQKLLRNMTVGRLIFNTILPDNMSYLGTPAMEVSKFRRTIVHFRNLQEIVDRIDRLEKERK